MSLQDPTTSPGQWFSWTLSTQESFKDQGVMKDEAAVDLDMLHTFYQQWERMGSPSFHIIEDGATLKFGRSSGQLQGVNLYFQFRLPVSREHGWSWDTTTIKTHVPTYKESHADQSLSC